MPSRSTDRESPFLFVSFGKTGAIETVSMFHALPQQAKKAMKARALIIGATKYQAFRVNPAKGDRLEFERL